MISNDQIKIKLRPELSQLAPSPAHLTISPSRNRPSLKAKTVPAHSLSPVALARMYCIFSKYYTNHSKETFYSDLFEKSHVILLLDSKTKEIQGFSTLLQIDLQNQGANALGVFSGDTVLEKHYWGSKALGVEFLKYLFLLKIKNPTRPVYWLLISKGYKTYLQMANNFKTYYPRFDQKTPPQFQMVMDQFYANKFRDYYNPATGLIEFGPGVCCLKEAVAGITDDLLKNPKVNFFTQKNLNWSLGHELVCIAEMTFLMPLQYIFKKIFLKKKDSK